jgi:ABC-2 type transport system permease protein
MDKGSAQEKNYRRLQSIKATQTVGDAMYAEQQEVLARRKRMADAMRFLSPVMLMQDIVAELSGNGSVRHSSFLRQIDQFHDQWRTFFIKRAEQGMRLDGNAYDSFPQFQHQNAAIKESSARVLAGFVAMLLFLVGAAAAAKVLLNRFRLAGR